MIPASLMGRGEEIEETVTNTVWMTNYYYCLGCKKIIVSVNRDYGPRCPKCRKNQTTESGN